MSRDINWTLTVTGESMPKLAFNVRVRPSDKCIADQSSSAKQGADLEQHNFIFRGTVSQERQGCAR